MRLLKDSRLEKGAEMDRITHEIEELLLGICVDSVKDVSPLNGWLMTFQVPQRKRETFIGKSCPQMVTVLCIYLTTPFLDLPSRMGWVFTVVLGVFFLDDLISFTIQRWWKIAKARGQRQCTTIDKSLKIAKGTRMI